jgi:hypothetical protein
MQPRERSHLFVKPPTGNSTTTTASFSKSAPNLDPNLRKYAPSVPANPPSNLPVAGLPQHLGKDGPAVTTMDNKC